MRIMAIIIIAISATLVGCAPANIIASKWDSGASGANVKTRCEEVDMRSNSGMKEVFIKYDGWKLVYLSEFTTGNRVGTSAVACFEQAK